MIYLANRFAHVFLMMPSLPSLHWFQLFSWTQPLWFLLSCVGSSTSCQLWQKLPKDEQVKDWELLKSKQCASSRQAVKIKRNEQLQTVFTVANSPKRSSESRRESTGSRPKLSLWRCYSPHHKWNFAKEVTEKCGKNGIQPEFINSHSFSLSSFKCLFPTDFQRNALS